MKLGPNVDDYSQVSSHLSLTKVCDRENLTFFS